MASMFGLRKEGRREGGTECGAGRRSFWRLKSLSFMDWKKEQSKSSILGRRACGQPECRDGW